MVATGETESRPSEAITQEEIEGTAEAAFPKAHNAFAELMSPTKRKAAPPAKADSRATKRPTVSPNFSGRYGLGLYTHDPTKVPDSQMIFYNQDFVAIHDLYPKASVHTLLLSTTDRNLEHPFDLFADPVFLKSYQDEVKKLKGIVAAELRRKYGRFSAQDKYREAVLNGNIELADGEELPKGRDWEKDVMVGIHADPSMAHLHVHVLSVDRCSPCMKNKHHYNSFSTPYFIDIADFPLAANDDRRRPWQMGYLEWDLLCWRCGMNFGNKLAQLKRHLEEEFEAWKAE
ncbi:hypothetical protein BP5796_00638 [Coleophoma crateriformis]|uniref:Aprataxin-like protein n=1 Tax=Coleophoma crateriformis TaxID=565419 RepID=A0A3D8T8L8_9HELO|nr:hypothetical protein BP5796_00638 [Coleophoma crateriformis]